jgi:Ras-related protein Rab-35
LFDNFFSYSTVGNKNDDPQRKVVLTEDAQRFADQMSIQLFETSAKDNINVEDMFLAITQKVLRHKKETQSKSDQQNDQKIKIGGAHDVKRSRGKKCC